MELAYAELCLGSRLSGADTSFGLVFHVEGLMNDRIFQLLRNFGKTVRGRFRPLLTCITPLCPMYHRDPWEFPVRWAVPRVSPDRPTLVDFAAKINDLSTDYEIGYHGHFYRVLEHECETSFENEVVFDQFDREYSLMSDLGYRPRAYAGGMWFMAPWLVAKLGEKGFEVDTTLNDVRRQSTASAQPYSATTSGEPFWIGNHVLEIPTVRSAGTIVRDILAARRNRKNFVVLALHDYNLLQSSFATLVRETMRALMKRERVLSISDLARASSTWLGSESRVW